MSKNSESKPVEKRCGTCKHFDGVDLCLYPLPKWIMVMSYKARTVSVIWGTDCSCWEPKE